MPHEDMMFYLNGETDSSEQSGECYPFGTSGANVQSINPEIIVPHNLNHEIVQKRD